MAKITFDPREPGGLELVRTVVLDGLKRYPAWNNMHDYPSGFNELVEYVGDQNSSKEKFFILVQEVCWEFIIQGIIAPGSDIHNPNLPRFHVTDYGRKVLATGEFLPHDPTNYLQRFHQTVGTPDPTVVAYLSESLNCFTRGCFIASVVMLGVASERAFNLLCDVLVNALVNNKERSAFTKILGSNAMKPKEDWVSHKIESIQTARPRPLPDNVNIMLTGIFDFIRSQRNSLGHPQDDPPKVTREDAFVNLRLFPGYYKILKETVAYLSHHNV
jgi:hypothetical protein